MEPTSPPARLIGRISAVAFFILMALLVASIAAPGVAAIGAFRTLPTLGLELPDFAAYALGSTEVMGRIAAGQAMNPIFTTAMIATMALAFAGLLAWIGVQAGGVTTHRRPMVRVTNFALVLLASLALASMLSSDGLERTLGNYLAHARDGNHALAETARSEFDVYHRTAERLNQAQLLLALVAIGCAVSALLPRSKAAS